MRVLVLGGADNEKIPQALRRDHLLYDHVPLPDDVPRPCPAGLYDAALLLTERTGRAA